MDRHKAGNLQDGWVHRSILWHRTGIDLQLCSLCNSRNMDRKKPSDFYKLSRNECSRNTYNATTRFPVTCFTSSVALARISFSDQVDNSRACYAVVFISTEISSMRVLTRASRVFGRTLASFHSSCDVLIRRGWIGLEGNSHFKSDIFEFGFGTIHWVSGPDEDMLNVL